jgi:hypothetical protein
MSAEINSPLRERKQNRNVPLDWLNCLFHMIKDKLHVIKDTLRAKNFLRNKNHDT